MLRATEVDFPVKPPVSNEAKVSRKIILNNNTTTYSALLILHNIIFFVFLEFH